MASLLHRADGVGRRDDRPVAALLDGHVVAQAPHDAEAAARTARAGGAGAHSSTGGIAAADPTLATHEHDVVGHGDVDVDDVAPVDAAAGGRSRS